MNRAGRRRLERLRKGGKLKYLRNELFIGVTGKPFEIEEEGQEKHQGTIGEVLKVTLGLYRPNPQLGIPALSIAEIRLFNRLLDILDGDPQEEDCFRFEDEDFKLLRKVMNAILPLTPYFRNAPLIEDILDGAGSKQPEARRDGQEAAPIPVEAK